MLPSPLLAPTRGGGSRAPPQPYKVLRPGGVSPRSPCILAASSQVLDPPGTGKRGSSREVSASRLLLSRPCL